MKSKLILAISLLAFTVSGYAQDEKNVEGITASPVLKVGAGFRFVEGPVWHVNGYLLFTDIPNEHIRRWEVNRPIDIFRENSSGANGLTFDREGRLLVCEQATRRLTRTEPDGAVTVIAETWQEKKLNSPNDVAVRTDGLIFFTDPTYGLRDRAKEVDHRGVYCVRPGGETTLLIDDFEQPNGIAFSPDEKFLYVTDSQAGRVRKFSVAEDGKLSDGKVIIEVPSPDGMKVDGKGRLFFTTSEKVGDDAFAVVVTDGDGGRLGVIPVPETPANCAFGGPENKTLFITARTGLYKVDVTETGITPWNSATFK